MMKSNGGKLPPLGASFLKSGDCVVHFYYSGAEQCRFAPLLHDALSKQYGVVVASTVDRHPVLETGLKAALFSRRLKNLVQLHVTPDLRSTVTHIAETTADVLKRTGEARVLVDFAGVVSHEGIFQVEADLHAALADMRVITISQYDGNTFPAEITLEQFQTHALTVVGNVFYSENRKFITPEAYLRARAANSRVSARAAGTGR
jgi:hypothetical protein